MSSHCQVCSLWHPCELTLPGAYPTLPFPSPGKPVSLRARQRRHPAAELVPVGILGPPRAGLWGCIGGCPGSHLGGFLCKPHRRSQQRKRNQTREMGRPQEKHVVGLLQAAGYPPPLPGLPCTSGSTSTAVCSLLGLPLQQESKR